MMKCNIQDLETKIITSISRDKSAVQMSLHFL